MTTNLTLQIRTALRKAGITLHIWTPEQADQAIGKLSPDAMHKVESLYERQLMAQLSGGLPMDHQYDLGYPSHTWLAAGILHAPLRIEARVLQEAIDKLEGKHRQRALSGLAAELRSPLAIFRLDEHDDRQSVLVCIDKPEYPLMLKVTADHSQPLKHQIVTVDAIYPLKKDDRYHWLQLLQQPGRTLYMDKQGIHKLIGEARQQAENKWLTNHRQLTEAVSTFRNPDFDKYVSVGSPMFFSNARYVLETIRQEKASPAQWLAMLQKAGGIKAGEDKWLGLSEWLAHHPDKVLSREDIRRYVDAHQIRLQEVDFHIPAETPAFQGFRDEFNQMVQDNEEDAHKKGLTQAQQYELAFEQMVRKYGDDFSIAFSHECGVLMVEDEECAAVFLRMNAIHDMHQRNVTEGLDGYHELAFWVEGIESWEDDDEIHFGQVGNGKCIGWVRFGEKTMERKTTLQEKWELTRTWPGPEAWICKKNPGTDKHIYTTGQWDFPHQKAMITETDTGFSLYNTITGQSSMHDSLDEAVDEYIESQIPERIPQKILFIDEIQSNRHQDSRKHGYRNPDEFTKAQEDYDREAATYNAFQDEMERKYNKKFGFELKREEMTEDEQRKSGVLRDNFIRAKSLFDVQQAIPPPAPFEKNWHELCMKRMFRYAVDNGFDRIAWTTGEQQGERYHMGDFLNGLTSRPFKEGIAYDSLDKSRIDSYEVKIQTMSDNILLNVSTDGTIFASSNPDYHRNHLSDVIGKRLAERVLHTDSTLHLSPSETGYVMNIEGMRTFYDTILPSFVTKYGKKWGVQVHETHIPQLGRWHIMDVTPAMSETVKQGMPMFMYDRSGKILGLALEDNIYLTPDGLNPETLVHEYTHVWSRAMMYGNPDGWQSVKQLLHQSPVWGEICGNPAYSDIRSDEDALASEVLAHLSGRINAAKLEKFEQSHPLNVMAAVRQALNRFWTWVGKHLFDLKHFTSIEEVTDRVLYDLAKGTKLETGKPLVTAPDKERLSAITVYQGKGGVPHIRCKIDGIQQMGRPLKGIDRMMCHHPENLHALAESYFRKELVANLIQSRSRTR